jgi:hypothetical protein
MASTRQRGESPDWRVGWTTAPRHLRMVHPCKPRRIRATDGARRKAGSQPLFGEEIGPLPEHFADLVESTTGLQGCTVGTRWALHIRSAQRGSPRGSRGVGRPARRPAVRHVSRRSGGAPDVGQRDRGSCQIRGHSGRVRLPRGMVGDGPARRVHVVTPLVQRVRTPRDQIGEKVSESSGSGRRGRCCFIWPKRQRYCC